MRLSELLKPQNIKLGLAAKNKSEAIAELVTLLATNHEVTDAKKVLDSVLEREGTRYPAVVARRGADAYGYADEWLMRLEAQLEAERAVK